MCEPIASTGTKGVSEASPSQGEPLFRFVTARQILGLDRIKARQELDFAPRAKHTSDTEDVLAFVFISHKWQEPENPDANGHQLHALKRFFCLVEEVLQVLARNHQFAGLPGASLTMANDLKGRGLDWPHKLEDLVEGMPQASSVVSRMKDRPDLMVGCDPLEHIWVWYDCLCLPQRFPFGKTPQEKKEFALALQNLDQLVTDCEFVQLTSDDYFQRAWCSFEHFQNSLGANEQEIVIHCEKILQCEQVEWCPRTEPPYLRIPENRAESTTVQLLQGLQKILLGQNCHLKSIDKQMMATIQERWELMHDRLCRHHRGVTPPDLCRFINGNRASQTKPLEQAMVRLVLELHASVFTMSCRDAATHALGGNTDSIVASCRFDANSDACTPNTGLQCGLHRHRCDGERIDRLQQSIEDAWVEVQCESETTSFVCPSGHPWQPGVSFGFYCCDSPSCPLKNHVIQPGHVIASCYACDLDLCYHCAVSNSRGKSESSTDTSSQECLETLVRLCGTERKGAPSSNKDILCQRRVTIDLVQLSNSILEQFGQRCTNHGDSAFVGLLALRNILAVSEKDSARLSSTMQKSNDYSIEEFNTSAKNMLKPNADVGKVADSVVKRSAQFLSTLSNEMQLDRDAAKEDKHIKRNGHWDDSKRLAAGSLRSIHSAIEAAVKYYAERLASDLDVPELVVSITLDLPRWVLLDMANANEDLGMHSLTNGDPYKFSAKALKYLEENPGCCSYQISPKDTPALSPPSCVGDKCTGGWSRCEHAYNQQFVSIFAHEFRTTSGTLDSWSVGRLPERMVGFSCSVAQNEIFVIGGVDESKTDPNDYHCRCNVYRAQLPLSSVDCRWTSAPDLLQGRRFHASCIHQDSSTGETLLLVGGGKATAIPGREAEILSSIEILELKGNKENGCDGERIATALRKDGLEMPVARSSHHMLSLGVCVFVFGGISPSGNNYRDHEARKCDIYDFRTGQWVEGPYHPKTEAWAFGGLAVVRDRFAIVFGGIELLRNQQLNKSWVLDLKPWTNWIRNGARPLKRPETSWIRGPRLPAPGSHPNICVATSEATGFEHDWILSVGAQRTLNTCLGLPLPAPPATLDPTMFWSTMTDMEWIKELKWKKLFATPKSFMGGVSTVLEDGTLALIGGQIPGADIPSASSSAIYYRRFHTTCVVPSSFEELKSDVGVMTEHMASSAAIRANGANHNAKLNSHFLVSRLGLAIPEPYLFARDGARKLIIIEGSDDRYCQRCLAQTLSLSASRSGPNATLYGLRPRKELFPGISHRGIFVCSKCLCEMCD